MPPLWKFYQLFPQKRKDSGWTVYDTQHKYHKNMTLLKEYKEKNNLYDVI